MLQSPGAGIGRSAVIIFLVDHLLASPEPQDGGGQAAIRRTASDYVEGRRAHDPARIERALHCEMVKRDLAVDRDTGQSVLDHGGAMRLVLAARGTPGETPAAPDHDQECNVAILDIFGNSASVRIETDGAVDYLHLVRWNDEWKIINMLDETRSAEQRSAPIRVLPARLPTFVDIVFRRTFGTIGRNTNYLHHGQRIDGFAITNVIGTLGRGIRE